MDSCRVGSGRAGAGEGSAEGAEDKGKAWLSGALRLPGKMGGLVEKRTEWPAEVLVDGGVGPWVCF